MRYLFNTEGLAQDNARIDGADPIFIIEHQKKQALLLHFMTSLAV
jgi:hypothetical protein